MNKNDVTTPKVLAYMLVLSMVGIQVSLFIWPVPGENKEMFVTFAQSLLTLAAAAVFFHVGSSSGSRLKDKAGLDPDAGTIQTKQTETTTTETSQETKP